jgi:hypothetical protein
VGYSLELDGNKASLDGVNETGWKPILHCSSERRAIARSQCGNTITVDPPR